jgi:hypothetical protein
MRIGVNLIPLRPGQMGGHEFYVRRLLRQLLLGDRRNHYVLFTAWWNDDSIDLPHGRAQKIMAVPKQEARETVPSGWNRHGTRVWALCHLCIVGRPAPLWISTPGCVAWRLICGSVR